MATTRTSGVYKITCLVNGRFYIGSSVDLHKRWISHKSHLRGNKHHCLPLQRAWNKYGEKSFIFEIIELIEPSLRIEREQYWLDTANPDFNVSMLAGNPCIIGHPCSQETRNKIGNANRGRKHTKEELEKMSIGKLGNKNSLGYQQTNEHKLKNSLSKIGKKTQPPSPETRAKISAANIGKTRGRILNSETKHRISMGKQKTYIVIDPDGNKVQIIGLKDFCKNNNLDDSKMIKVAKGIRKHHKNWKCQYG